jgi:hypothetical protein
MSSNQFGLALVAPSKQTLIPIMTTSGALYGFYPIADTTFAGTETTFTLSDGEIPITSVTLPPKNLTNVYDERRVQQFMVAQWPAVQDGVKPWRGYSEFVDVAIPNTLGYYSWWSMPVTSWFKHFGRGVYVNSLLFGMNKFLPSASPQQTPPDIVTPQTLQWACTQNLQAFTTDCAFIDFRWDLLFEAVQQSDPNQQGNTTIPLNITTTSNPAGGFFKASVVQGSGGQTIVPGGGVVFNTVRILRLQDPTAGDYVFNFAIQDDQGQTTPAVLTLTVV